MLVFFLACVAGRLAVFDAHVPAGSGTVSFQPFGRSDDPGNAVAVASHAPGEQAAQEGAAEVGDVSAGIDGADAQKVDEGGE